MSKLRTYVRGHTRLTKEGREKLSREALVEKMALKIVKERGTRKLKIMFGVDD